MNDSVEAQPTTASLSTTFRQRIFPAWRNPWLIVALLALGLAGWQWIETRIRLADTQQELAKRLSESDTLAHESQTLARQAQDRIGVLQARLGELEGQLAESKSQQATLEKLYQELARSREEWALAEIEQGVTLAAQQLQLAGNVAGAILALQAAEARLAGSGRPRFSALRQALGRDLARLRALPLVDQTGISMRLENLAAAVDALPLAVDGRPRAEAAKESPAVPGVVGASILSRDFWWHLAQSCWAEVRGLIRIQRFDRNEPALLAPGQDFFLRENLKLRLLNARLALLARDAWTFRNELKQAQGWIERYFDLREKTVQTAQAALAALRQSEVSVDLPNLNESLSALKSLKLGKDAQ